MKRSPKPGKPLRRKTWLRPRSRLKTKAPLREVNPERRDRLRLEQFGSEERQAFMREGPCDVCRVMGPTEASHYPSRAAGGKKRDQYRTCRPCHDELHRLGPGPFEELHDVDIRRLTRNCDERFDAQ